MGLYWVNQQLKREPTALAHIMAPEDRVVFTGTTEAMQAFIKQHLNDADAWNDMYDEGLVRVGTAPAANWAVFQISKNELGNATVADRRKRAQFSRRKMSSSSAALATS